MSSSPGLLTVGVMASDHIAVGLVEDHKVKGKIYKIDDLLMMPAESIAPAIYREVVSACEGAGVSVSAVGAIGLGFPGVIRDGIVQESPNIQQVKGLNLANSMTAVLSGVNSKVPVLVLNDADAMAAGVAATQGSLEKLVRVWTLGNGIGFGRYPMAGGAWECGHMVVTLDPKEKFCGCGGVGHLEGIMGHRAMRLRFLDMEPEEVFAAAKTGDARCAAFTKLWHRALAAATASLVHQEEPGRFYITGSNAVYVEPPLLNEYLHEMVKMSPLQGSVFEVVPTSDEVAVIGAAVSARFSMRD